jgi:anti-sigma-K factor RskA
MDPRRHRDLVDKLAAEYAVGTLRAGARRRFEQLARHDPGVQATIDRWQHYLADLPALWRCSSAGASRPRRPCVAGSACGEAPASGVVPRRWRPLSRL